MAIRIGLIGAGGIGRAHLQSLAAVPDVQVAAICDSDRGRAEAAAPAGASVHINFRTMIEAERLDAVFICLPPFARGEPEILAARAGIHLFVERPVAVSVQKAREVQKEIEKAGIVAAVGHSWRYLSGVDKARELLKDRKVALVRAACFTRLPPPGWRRRRESAGGQLYQEGADLIDLARCLVGDIASVAAAEFQGIAAAGLADYDVEDSVAATMRFLNGAVGEIVVSDVGPALESSLAILTDRSEIRLTQESLEVLESGKRTILEHAGSALAAAQQAFFGAVRTGDVKNIRSSYADAARTLAVAVAAGESVRTGVFVNL